MDAFSTARCHLRLLHPGDEALYGALYTDRRVMAHIAAPLDAAGVRRGFDAACRGNADRELRQRHWAVLDRRDGSPFGLLALFEDTTDPGSAELGVMLLPDAQGRGLTREIMDALLALVFGSGTEFQRIWARHEAAHPVAAAVLASSGFVADRGIGAHATRSITRGQWLHGAGQGKLVDS